MLFCYPSSLVKQISLLVIPPYVPPKGNFIVFYSDTEFTVTPYNGWSGGSESALEFSTDKSNWEPLDKTKLETKTAVKSGNKYYLYFRGTDNNTMGTNYDNNNHWILTSSNVFCSGNIENLLDYKTVEKGGHPKMNTNCFSYMFYKCSALATAPELPATTLANYCYLAMFAGCTSLATAPELPSTSLAIGCYQDMFADCTSLATAPELPATMLNGYCYSYMFSGCTSLIQAPELPAIKLTENCYFQMFYGCTSLTKAPELPATTLIKYCYYKMFYGCEKLNSVTCLATNIDASDCLLDWLNGTAEKGTFTKAKETTIWTVGGNVPTGWTIQEIQ